MLPLAPALADIPIAVGPFQGINKDISVRNSGGCATCHEVRRSESSASKKGLTLLNLRNVRSAVAALFMLELRVAGTVTIPAIEAGHAMERSSFSFVGLKSAIRRTSRPWV